ncbi:Uncharacterized membrane protein [Deinococcus reticulitermitis]|uniref:Uncharacterized membrane protein n=1 Tax=Deinococcus reticulitermitis TaxID=856736 RepID=A0A1H7AE00_9DEIO|nr:DUF1648 domain-containing protein [Deinococcus reticulitermitis]SEJ63841.1 Uncharacterized membrane protein [Deinococcus reticulitermitis]
MTRSRIDLPLGLGTALTLALLGLSWPHLPEGERLALLPLSMSSVAMGILLYALSGLDGPRGAYSRAFGRGLVWQGVALAAAAHFGWSWDRVLAVSTGLLFVSLGNVTGRAQPSEWFGLRTRWTLLSERAWYATHRQAAPALMAVGAVYTAFAALTPRDLLVPWVMPLALLILLLPITALLYRLSRQEYERDPERRPAVPGARRHLPPYSQAERLLLGVLLALPSLTLLALGLNWERLPESVPMHFGAGGQPDRFGSRWELLGVPALALGLGALGLGLGRVQTATVAQRHFLITVFAGTGALLSGLTLASVTGQVHVGLGVGHAGMLGVFALAFWLPGPDGRPHRRAAGVFLGLAALSAGLALTLPGRGAEAVSAVLLAFGAPLFLAPVFLWKVETAGGSRRRASRD